MGAWIETVMDIYSDKRAEGRSLMGAWIETPKTITAYLEAVVAPLWERGLKPTSSSAGILLCMSLPYGSVD